MINKQSEILSISFKGFLKVFRIALVKKTPVPKQQKIIILLIIIFLRPRFIPLWSSLCITCFNYCRSRKRLLQTLMQLNLTPT